MRNTDTMNFKVEHALLVAAAVGGFLIARAMGKAVPVQVAASLLGAAIMYAIVVLIEQNVVREMELALAASETQEGR